MKFYVELKGGPPFVVEAESENEAIADFWCRRITDPGSCGNCSDGPQVAASYMVHQGRAEFAVEVQSGPSLWLVPVTIRPLIFDLVRGHDPKKFATFIKSVNDSHTQKQAKP